MIEMLNLFYVCIQYTAYYLQNFELMFDSTSIFGILP